MVPLTNSVASQLSFALLVLFVILFRKQFSGKATELISRTLHVRHKIYLCYRYPIKHHEDKTSLPTSRYQWPNGQGDVAKFLEGEENSNVWAKNFGRTYRIWSGMKPEVVLTRPEHIKEVFKDSDKHYKAVDNNSGYLMSQILGQCVGLVSGNQWQNLRSVTEKAFTRTASIGYVQLVEERMKSYFKELQNSGTFSQGLLDPAEDLKLLPFLVVAEVIYGKLSPELERQLRSIAPRREALFRHVISGGLARFSVSKYLPTKANHALADFRSEWYAVNKMAYDLAVSSGSNAPIISLYAAADGGEITHEQMYQTLDEMLYANLDVTLGGISWNVVFLAANHDIQTSLRAEVAAKREEAANTKGERHHPSNSVAQKTFHAYLLSSSTLLAACVLESARLRPLAAFSVPQSAPTPRLVDGYLVPARTSFVIDSYALNIRNPFWGADSETYRPQRFLESRKGMATEMRYNYWRFGFGPRQCMGKYVADLVIRMLLVELVEGFELEMREEDRAGMWKRDRETWINHPKMLVECQRRKSVGE